MRCGKYGVLQWLGKSIVRGLVLLPLLAGQLDPVKDLRELPGHLLPRVMEDQGFRPLLLPTLALQSADVRYMYDDVSGE